MRRIALAAMLAAGVLPPALAQPVAQAAAAGAAQRPAIRLLRADEDWRALRDPALRTEALDAIRYIPFRRDGAALTLGGEIRPWFEDYNNDNWGRAPDDDNGYFLQRAMLHGALWIDDEWRLFAQLKSGYEAGRNGGPRPPDEDILDWHQAFVERRGGGGAWLLRAGRQELNYGSGRLLTFREGPNVRQSFDALRLSARRGAWTVDAFYGQEVETDRGRFDDDSRAARAIWGVYGVRPLPALGAGAHLDLYWLALRRDDARFAVGVADERRHSLGARLWGVYGAFDYNFEAVAQLGSFGDDDIRAWTLASDSGWRPAGLPWRPRLNFKANVTSGDDDPADGRLGTFNALYPRGNYFGRMTTVGPYNHIDASPGITMQPLPALSVELAQRHFWRQSRRDGLYGAPGNLLRAPGTSRARYVGRQPELELLWTFNASASLNAVYGRFYPGPFLRETPPGERQTYRALWFTYRF